MAILEPVVGPPMPMAHATVWRQAVIQRAGIEVDEHDVELILVLVHGRGGPRGWEACAAAVGGARLREQLRAGDARGGNRAFDAAD